MKKFHMGLHPEKTRLLEFGPYAIDNRQRRGEGKPETFNFLSFTHICVKKKSKGRFTVLRQTIRKRLQTKLNEMKAELQRRMHAPIPEQGQWLLAVVGGHLRYYGVPMNKPALVLFRFRVGWLWHRSLSRRSQNGRVLWNRMRCLITRWLPSPSVCHPLSSAAHGRRRLKQEPDAAKPLVRIRGGGKSNRDTYSAFSF
jgi:RNA-directed DNA polymerase